VKSPSFTAHISFDQASRAWPVSLTDALTVTLLNGGGATLTDCAAGRPIRFHSRNSATQLF